MTRQLTPEEIKTITVQQNNSPVVRYLRTRDKFRFSVGDFLIKKVLRGDKWGVETISHVSSQPKRYICIHEDEYGIKYIKSLSSFGEELPVIHILSDVDDYTQYEVDPEYAEHIILDGDGKFDFSEKRKEAKALRDQITKKNKKISIRTYKIEEIDQLIEKLKVGDKVWMGHTIPSCASSSPVVVVGVTSGPQQSYGYSPREKTYTIEFGYTDPQYKNTFKRKSEDLVGQVIMLTEPYKYETI